jgi:hypothetical protein
VNFDVQPLFDGGEYRLDDALVRADLKKEGNDESNDDDDDESSYN